MQYKTIALELIQENPELYEQLRSSKRLLPAMDAWAIELKASHDRWKEQLSQAKPDSDPRQVASEAMELAVQELKDLLPSASTADETEPFSLDAAMNFLRGIRRPSKARPRPANAADVRPATSARRFAKGDRPAGFLQRFPSFCPAASDRGLSPASLQPEPPAATGQTAFTKDDFPKGEPSVSPVAAGTGRHDAAGGLKPVPRLFARYERPRLSGPSKQKENPPSKEPTIQPLQPV